MPIVVQRLRGAFASACVALSLIGCGGGSSSNPPTPEPPAPVTTGQITGQVLSAADASPVAGARITAAGATATSDAQGRFTLGGLAPAASVVLRIQADGHLDVVRPLPVAANQTTQITQRLVAAGAAQTFNAATPGTLSVANSLAAVDLPANGFVVDGSSTAATGTLSARLSVIDPARNPGAMPGRYVASTGRAIESFGAITVDLRDAGGNKVNLKAGTTATIRIPLATRSAAPPATVPLFHLDETTGQWVQEGQATLRVTAAGSYYEGTVSHFSSWNADIETDTIFVNGCVNDSAGKPAAWALVQTSGIDYSGMSYDVTDTNGKFRVPIRKNSLAELLATLDQRSTPTITVGPSATDITLPNCLVLADAAAPQIVTSPVDRTVVAGQFVYFRVSASGGALRYQWQRNGVDMPGETFDTLSFYAALADDGARYTVVVRNSQGQVTSGAAVLHVNPATLPVVTEQPRDASARVGETASFAVTVVGSAPLTYQWQRNGVDIAGATAAAYTTPALALADQGALYRVVVRNAYGSATSAPALLSVTGTVPAAPVITAQPVAVTATVGQTATFLVLGNGNPAPTYQWLKNGAVIAGATGQTYTTPALAAGDDGALFSVKLSNSQGEVVSSTALLTVKPAGNDTEQANLMRLLGAGSVWLQAVGAPLEVADDNGLVLAASAVCQTGSVSATLGGAAVTVGQALPANGVLATRFTDCVSDGTRYNGSGTADYRLSSLSAPVNGSATVTLSSLRMADVAGDSDYTVDGGATVTLTGSQDGTSLTQSAALTPTAGSSIANNLLGLRATLAGGGLSVGSTTRLSDGVPTGTRVSYNSFAFSVGSTPYLAQGALTLTFGGTNGGLAGGSGEITLSSNGTQVGRLYFANGSLQIEVNGRVQPFAAPRGSASARR
ncbi:carboxypeptidase regulatory-like domain-containing protein [Roseateles cellulosilyticus]|uniref:Carboxypeptidase regulatory-like domain-containing protein n=1 Tax=Pelomonas cellulosilytica TaxID=2906762 RepID=A0ABS8XST0_9BURK|nr:carboxypeptidase regulatory-like domain-containing protein [Pelomonas sp. P8]MCE4555776.1 carboxypeptidase regulatory-like domain-containing protein [Pelomonas sp. P8]